MPARAPTPIWDLDAKDSGLVRLPRQMNGGALRIIMQRYNRRLSRRPFHCGDDSEADDIIQETHVNAISNPARRRGECGLGTWLTRITLGEALERVRRRRSTVELAKRDFAEPSKA